MESRDVELMPQSIQAISLIFLAGKRGPFAVDLLVLLGREVQMHIIQQPSSNSACLALAPSC
jgi:hypothetical protein